MRWIGLLQGKYQIQIAEGVGVKFPYRVTSIMRSNSTPIHANVDQTKRRLNSTDHSRGAVVPARTQRSPHPSSRLRDMTASFHLSMESTSKVSSTFKDYDVQAQIKETASPSHLNRIRRATHNIRIGFDPLRRRRREAGRQRDVTDTDTVTRDSVLQSPESSLGSLGGALSSGSRESTATEVLLGSAGGLSFGLNEEDSASFVDEQQKRLAQDMLLVKELEGGILPEDLLKKLPYMRHVTTLDLSHFGIGDGLGQCLGYRWVGSRSFPYMRFSLVPPAGSQPIRVGHAADVGSARQQTYVEVHYSNI